MPADEQSEEKPVGKPSLGGFSTGAPTSGATCVKAASTDDLSAKSTSTGALLDSVTPAERRARTTDYPGRRAELSFSELWAEQHARRRKPDNPAKWDERIAKTPFNYGPSAYSHQFLKLAQLRAEESVFDMGCGAGSLAIPCALDGHRVTAADFSDGMLARLAENAQEHDVAPASITSVKLSWNDDWEAAGVAPKSHDVAFASRSIMTDNLEGAIRHLTNVARRKVCVTVVPGFSPRCHLGMLRDLGLTPTGYHDAIFTFAIAQELGLMPEVRYLTSTKVDAFPTPKAAFDKYATMLVMTKEGQCTDVIPALEERLCHWLRDNLELTPLNSLGEQDRIAIERDLGAQLDTVPNAVWLPKLKREVTWAFISWEAPPGLI